MHLELTAELVKKVVGVMAACLVAAPHSSFSQAVDSSSPRYLFAWSGDLDRRESDFLTVIDLTSSDGRYGRVVATVPVGERGLWPHHTEHELHPSRTLFANGFAGNRTFVFDVSHPLRPRVIARVGEIEGLSFPHSFVRLPNGHVLATFQGNGRDDLAPGGLAELDPEGVVVRSRSAADVHADPTTLRPYSLAVVPSLDRVVVALHRMALPDWQPASVGVNSENLGNQVQIWRLSKLEIIKTIKLADAPGPNEPRVLGDDRTVLVNTVMCRLYRVKDLAGEDPTLELIHAESDGWCAGPVVVGDYWVQANAGLRTVFTLDVSDARRARKVSTIQFDDRQRPHWLATDGSRIAVVNEPFAEPRIWMLKIDPSSGVLVLDSEFRDSETGRPGISFERSSWPHGPTGVAVPHGTVFGD